MTSSSLAFPGILDEIWTADMSLLDRISFLIRANVEDLLRRSDNPEAEIDQVLHEMAEGIGEARQQIAAMIVQERELKAQLTDARDSADSWRTQAERAVRAGSDDFALDALRGERDALETASIFEQQISLQHDAIQQLRNRLGKLEQRRQMVESERDILLARSGRAAAATSLSAQETKAFAPDATSGIADLEKSAGDAEAQASAAHEVHTRSIERQFEALESESEFQSELDRMKREIDSRR